MKIASWNIKQGGFKEYSPELNEPEREDAILGSIFDLDVNSLTLTDTYRWDDYYGTNEEIAEHLSYPIAKFADVFAGTRPPERGTIGIVHATNVEGAVIDDLEMGDDRRGLRTIFNMGEYGLQLASVYLDHADEDNRLRQAKAMLSGLEKDIPTIITGDLNALRENYGNAPLLHKIGNRAIHIVGLLPAANPIKRFRSLDERRVIPYLLENGYKDADTSQQATMPSFAPALGLDYILHDDRVKVRNFVRHKDITYRKASDHLPISAEINL